LRQIHPRTASRPAWLSIAAFALLLHDLAQARSRKAFDRIFEEGGKRRR
jgi:hypothetical protein